MPHQNDDDVNDGCRLRELPRHRRSISQLICNLADHDQVVGQEGLANLGYQYDELDHQFVYGQFDMDDSHLSENTALQSGQQLACSEHNSTATETGHYQHHHHHDGGELNLSGCLPDFQFSMIDSEYDECLNLPDGITIISSVGDKPVLVERCKEGTDYDEFDENDLELRRLTVIPFTRIYAPSIKFTSFQRKIFMPGIEIQVRVVDTERSITTHLLNPNLYTIKLTHGPFSWTIKRRYKHFSSLHQQLSIFRTSLNIPFPMRSHKEKRATIKNAAIQMADEKRIKELQKSTSFKNSITANGHTSYSRATGTSAMAALQNTSTNEMSDMAAAAHDGSGSGRRKKRKKRKLPRFPQRPESLVMLEAMPERILQLQDYLYNLLNISLYRNHHETLNFVEVSNVSFVDGLGIKGKEGAILKRTGSTRPGQAGCNFFGCFQQHCCVRCNYFCTDLVCGSWRNRWFFVKETCFGYLRPSDGVIRAVILFDMGFDVSTGIYQTGMRKGLQILTNNRHIVLKCWTRRKCKEWNDYLKQTANTTARDFTMPNPHNSYAPERSDVSAQWFVDGSAYMTAVADALEAATEEIYITDWWLSPEIYMKRPAIDGDYWRLDKILLRKAKEGVRIFVLLFKEVEMALGINSYYSKQRLVNLHENIKVMRHPDHAKVGVFFWAHHEKMVVVDQTYAFLGGIDLCYGRWDDYRHRLTDLGSISTSSASGSTRRPGGIFSREEVDSAFGSRKSSQKEKTDLEASSSSTDEHKSLDRLQLPSLVPGDKLMIPNAANQPLGDNIDLEGLKLNTPEMERKNMLRNLKDNAVKNCKDLVHRLTMNETAGDNDAKQSSVFTIPQINECHECLDDPTPFQTQVLDDYYGQAKYWFGKDYSNFIMKDWMHLDAPFVDMIDRTTTPRMPWHDVAIWVVGAAARDVARHFIQRWNAMKLEKTRDNCSFPYLMPKSYQQITLNPNIVLNRTQRVSCQLLRSVSSWSCGFIEQDLVEQSIHDAYIQTITKAQHYIYIENQFFITMQLGVTGSLGHVRNQIGEALFKRIVRAHKERKTFRVYVIMPLLPGFEGDVGGNSGNAVRAITHWNYASISRGRTAILVRLKEVGIKNPGDYISFHSLRTHSYLNNVPITELIYVHSKLLISDDRVVICGSANINDRSMIGKRDSEIAAIITDNEFADGRMNGQKYPSGVFAGRLRKFLFNEHLGLLDPDNERLPAIDIIDPVIDQFWHGTWKRISMRNTEIYDEVFKCMPSDQVKTLAHLKKYQEETPPLYKTDPDVAAKRIINIQGNLVDLPLDFLNKEVLTPPGTSKEGLIPTSVWT